MLNKSVVRKLKKTSKKLKSCWLWDQPNFEQEKEEEEEEEEEKNEKVREICQLFGKILGTAHIHCNLNLKQSNSSFIATALQNMTNKDSYLFMRKLTNQKDHNIPFEVIPKPDERYMSKSYGRLGNPDSIKSIENSFVADFTALVKIKLTERNNFNQPK